LFRRTHKIAEAEDAPIGIRDGGKDKSKRKSRKKKEKLPFSENNSASTPPLIAHAFFHSPTYNLISTALHIHKEAKDKKRERKKK